MRAQYSVIHLAEAESLKLMPIRCSPLQLYECAQSVDLVHCCPKITVSWRGDVLSKRFDGQAEAFLKMRLSPGQISQAQRCRPEQRPSDRRSVGRKPGAASAAGLSRARCSRWVRLKPSRSLAKGCQASVAPRLSPYRLDTTGSQ
jgi:hypothetical protein